jgi:hypothetical protein
MPCPRTARLNFATVSLGFIAQWIATLILPADPVRAVLVPRLVLRLLIVSDSVIVLFAQIRLLSRLPVFGICHFFQLDLQFLRLGRSLFRVNDGLEQRRLRRV